MKKMKTLVIETRATNRTDNIMRYFQEVSQTRSISQDEEIELAHRIAQGDTEAEKILVESNLRFVISVAKQYSTNPDLMQDLVSQGNIGLLDAARSFDPTRGFKFISYAVFHIRKEMLDYITKNGRTVRIPSNVSADISRVKKAEDTLITKLGRDATLDEISEELTSRETPISASRISQLRMISERALALEWSPDEDTKAPIQNIDSKESADLLLQEFDSSIYVRELLRPLSDIEKDIVQRRCGFENDEAKSFSEISSKYGKTSEWARMAFNTAIRKMRAEADRLKSVDGSDD